MNDTLINKLLNFTDNVLMADNHTALAKQLRTVIEKQIKSRETSPISEFELNSLPVCYIRLLPHFYLFFYGKASGFYLKYCFRRSF